MDKACKSNGPALSMLEKVALPNLVAKVLGSGERVQYYLGIYPQHRNNPGKLGLISDGLAAELWKSIRQKIPNHKIQISNKSQSTKSKFQLVLVFGAWVL